MKTFLIHFATALFIGFIGVPVIVSLLITTNKEFDLVEDEVLFTQLTLLFTFIALVCRCRYLIKEKGYSRWANLYWFFGGIGIGGMGMFYAFTLID